MKIKLNEAGEAATIEETTPTRKAGDIVEVNLITSGLFKGGVQAVDNGDIFVPGEYDVEA
jgi:hypothetical protein